MISRLPSRKTRSATQQNSTQQSPFFASEGTTATDIEKPFFTPKDTAPIQAKPNPSKVSDTPAVKENNTGQPAPTKKRTNKETNDTLEAPQGGDIKKQKADGDLAEITLTPFYEESTSETGAKFWSKQAAELKKDEKTLSDIDNEKIALILLIYKKGVFNAFGEGENTNYIRSQNNTVLKINFEIKGNKNKLSSDDNAAGKLPDIYRDITPKEFIEIVKVLEKRHIPAKLERKPFEGDYIESQRNVSKLLMEQIKTKQWPAPINKHKIVEFIHEGNYAPVNIHFPALKAYISQHKEKNSAGALTYSSVTKFLMARLINIYNADVDVKDKQPLLAEKSSFGFQVPTLGDLGESLTIRLSPGIDIAIVKPLMDSLNKLIDELKELLDNKETRHFNYDSKKEGKSLRKYWGQDAKNKWQSYTKEKTILEHLLFTLMEKGSKKVSMLTRIMYRHPDNIIALSKMSASLLDLSKAIVNMHNITSVEKGITSSLQAPWLSTKEARKEIDQNINSDEVTTQRLSILKEIAKKIEEKTEKEEWEDDVSDSDSEFEKSEKYGNKLIVPSGMATIHQLLNPFEPQISASPVNSKKTEPKIDLAPDTYYEFLNHYKNKKFIIPGFDTKDNYLVDLNPNITTPSKDAKNTQKDDEKKVVNDQVFTIIEDLKKRNVKVWIVDITSSSLPELNYLYNQWDNEKNVELLIEIASGLKNQQHGLNMNPYGTIHWVYRNKNDQKKFEALKTFFSLQKNQPINKRSIVSNEIRRYFKKLGGISWKNMLAAGENEKEPKQE
ncbi:hypothetical protein [Chitinophaga nivalis]|uniref:Uncharacterized protein n=1 Tax=Chitinophaga nivalis TaxID=2991709 RepID=A0ABT3IH71_9BACT|nr:hypothetical protein [Chitinophaga nivalis]MCW3466996.1 hypothetical protein [Chitinophaga nivalis]MCW3483313.1 hypothetical protein [Chitinophaga nivalis]